MRHILFILVFALFSIHTSAQNTVPEKALGFALNTNLNGEFYLFQCTPSLLYSKGKHQVELGLGFNPTNRQTQKLLNTDINYKFYPNDRGEKYNLFFFSNLTYLHRSVKSYYPAKYNYFFLNGGYGLEVKPLENFYLSTSVSAGTFTYNKRSETQYILFKNKICSMNSVLQSPFNLLWGIGFRIGLKICSV